MIKPELKIKLEFINGLQEIVLNEIKQYSNFQVIKKGDNSIYLRFIDDFALLKNLRSVLRVFTISEDFNYNPLYLAKHKSIIGDIVTLVSQNNKHFKTFKIICAGSDSLVVRSIADYIQNTFGLKEKDDADLKIHIVKNDGTWELGAQISPMPLSVRNYKVKNMEGAMDPTIAYAVNSLCSLENVNSYLNVFSGSATLLIEAGQCYTNIKNLVGFDISKEALSLSMKNIKESGLIKAIKVKEADIFDQPQFGKFDVVTADLPFGMLVSKHEDLESLYHRFIDYCQDTLNDKGTLVVYTVKSDLLKKIIKQSNFKITKSLPLKIFASSKVNIYPTIFVCKHK